MKVDKVSIEMVTANEKDIGFLKQEIAELKSSNFALSVKIEELEKKLSKGSASKKRVAKNDSTSNSDK